MNAILQDSQGFMWFATQEGLNRFDGYSFEVFRHDPKDPTTLSSGFLLSLTEDRDGYLWVGTDGGGLNRWDPNLRRAVRYRNAPSDPRSLSNDRVTSLLVDRSGELWIGTKGGLNRLNREDGTFARFNHDPANEGSLGSNQVEALHEAADGTLWIGHASGLDRFDSASGSFAHYRHDPNDPTTLPNPPVNAIYQDDAGTLWVGATGGLGRRSSGADDFTRFQHDPENMGSLSHDLVVAITQDVEGSIWIGTERGLNRFRPSTETFFRYFKDPSNERSLGDNIIYTLYQDRGAVLWIGHKTGGLSKFNVTAGFFPHFQHEPTNPRSLSHSVVSSFAEGPDGKLWVGTYGGGLNHFDLESGLIELFRHDSGRPSSIGDDWVMALHADPDGDVWAGTRQSGLWHLDTETGRSTRYRKRDDGGGLSSNGITSIINAGGGRLWIGTYGGGLNRFDPTSGRVVLYQHESGNTTTLSDDFVLALLAEGEEALWVGTERGGLNRLDLGSGSFTHFKHDPDWPSSLSDDAVISLLLDSRDNLWIGTKEGGVNRWRLEDRQLHRNAFTSFNEEDGLANDTVFGILEDDDGYLWFSTNHGLSQFDPTTEVFRNYDVLQGLQSNEFNSGAYLKTSDGTLLFGGINGFNAFQPDRIHPNTHVPPVVFTGFWKLNEPADLPSPIWQMDEVEIGHRDYAVAFEVAALDYTSPEKNRYAYMLEGFDAGWVDLGHLRRISYTNLNPGRYRLRVRGSNNDGIWNDSGTTLSLHVVPPPWRSWWAYTLYALIGATAVVSYTRSQARKLEREAEYSRKLEQEVDARTAELAKRNEQLEEANQSLEQASLTDSLTGLRNRRFVVTNIEEEVALAERRHETQKREGGGDPLRPDFLFLMFDLDGLKQINDNYGHAAGDELLIHVKDLLERICRKSDTVVRWGGDEFLIVGRDANHDAAELLAERVRKTMEENPFVLKDGEEVPISCSLGFAFHPFFINEPALLNWEQVLAVADRALYAAKKSGRNAWVGILSTDADPPDDFFRGVYDAPQELAKQGIIRIRTSLSEDDELLWEM